MKLPFTISKKNLDRSDNLEEAFVSCFQPRQTKIKLTHLFKRQEQKCFEFIICNRINLHFLHLSIKSELKEQLSYKVATVISIEFDLLFLVSLQCEGGRATSPTQLPNLILPICSSYYLLVKAIHKKAPAIPRFVEKKIYK